MLLELNIKNFAIIDDLKVSFNRGLNLLTGETGSGKSIIIEALGIILGGRGSKNLIRKNEKTAILQALFLIEDLNRLKPILDKYGINVDDDKLLIITREISLNRPSISRINDKTITLSVLNEISSQLVDIFAQHEHQSLLDVNNHILLIDSFGDNEFNTLKNKFQSLYEAYIIQKRKLIEMDKGPKEREREIDLLKFQIDEIDMANLRELDQIDIENEYTKISNVKDISIGMNSVLESLNSSQYEDHSILNYINKNISILNNLIKFDANIEDYLNRFKELNYEFQDLYNDMNSYLDNIYIDDKRLNFLSERLDEVNKLKRKYGNSILSILAYRNTISEDLEKLMNYENEIEKLHTIIKDYENELYELSGILSENRKEISQIIEQKIMRELKDLNMGDINFKVNFKKKDKLGINGIDHIEFLISTNLGETLKPLSKIVSGGEMSRIMLAFKSVLAEYDGIPTMIFDEIDTGISGRTAQIVGEKILHISNNHQIISITHLPQITALADSHYLISKRSEDNETITDIKMLNKEERIQEMARLLGGVNVTSKTLDHAHEMITMSKKIKTES